MYSGGLFPYDVSLLSCATGAATGARGAAGGAGGGGRRSRVPGIGTGRKRARYKKNVANSAETIVSNAR